MANPSHCCNNLALNDRERKWCQERRLTPGSLRCDEYMTRRCAHQRDTLCDYYAQYLPQVNFMLSSYPVYRAVPPISHPYPAYPQSYMMPPYSWPYVGTPRRPYYYYHRRKW